MKNSCGLWLTPLKEKKTCTTQQCGYHARGVSPRGQTNTAVPGPCALP